MKGTVVVCLQELIVAKFGRDAWCRVLEGAGLDAAALFLPLADVEDATVLKLIAATCQVTGLAMEHALQAYADYWVSEYTKGVYTRISTGCHSAREFLGRIDEIHASVTKTVPNAHPPRFRLEWQGEQRLLLHYQSGRNLIDLAVAMARSVGKHFGERVTVTKLSPTALEVVFHEAARSAAASGGAHSTVRSHPPST